MSAVSETLSVDTDDFIATVTLQKTTMSPAFFAECEQAFRELGEHPDLRAVVVRAAGKCFSYGLDLPAAFSDYGPVLAGGLADSRTRLWRLIRRLQGAFTAVAECPVPVIASVHGWCIGGGLDFISACDIRLASRDARFSLREARIAIVADVGSLQRLPAIIGKGHARELAFTGKDIDAERAAEIGLVNGVYDDREALDAATAEMAREIAGNAPLTVRGVKEVLDFGEGKTAADGLRYVAVWNSAFLPSEDLGEAAAAFAAKRAPHFKGK
jgi:enoyl-CoA hydratase